MYTNTRSFTRTEALISRSSVFTVRRVLIEVMPHPLPPLYRTFLQDLEGCLETPERVGACFLQRVSKLVITPL